MGRIKKKAAVPLSLFYLRYFAYIIIFTLVLAVSLVMVFNAMVTHNMVYPADYAQEQAREAYDQLQSAEQITPDLIPELCDYAVFDLSGKMESGDLSEREAGEAWKAVSTDQRQSGRYYFMEIPREDGYCVLRYEITPQYRSPFLQEFFLPPQTFLILLALLGILVIVVVEAVCFGKKLKKKLAVLTAAADKVGHQELDFEISPSGIREIDVVLDSMDQMRGALKESLEQQWGLEQEKNRQMSALAHDLKTPLTIVRGNAELLLETELTQTQQKYTEYIEGSSLQMQNYLQTLIQVTKSWQGYRFCPQMADVTVFLEGIRGQAEGLCMANNLELVWQCQCSSGSIFVDRDLMERAILNVVSNAVEHSLAGGCVTVSAAVEQETMVFVISDQGKGFSAEALKHGTEQFFMDDASRNSRKHFGLGLYIADSVVQKHHGKLLLENDSETGGGRVTIRIPRNPDMK